MDAMNEARVYLSVLVHVAVFTFVIATATVVVHEYGHFVSGSLLGCSNSEIVLLDQNFETYTKMSCMGADSGRDLLLALSSFLFIIPLSLVMFFLSRYEKYHSFVILGFNMIISASDFSYFPQALGTAALLAGALLVVYGENLLVDRYITFVEGGKVTIGVPFSIIGLVAFVAALFTIKFYINRRKIASRVYNSPSVVFLGAGAEHVARNVAGTEPVHYRGMKVHLDKKKVMVHSAPHHEIRKMNVNSIVYAFDNSSVEKQIRDYRKYQKMFAGKNIVRTASGSAVPRINKKLGTVHDISTSKGIAKLRNSLK
jgi:hypothetical protein